MTLAELSPGKAATIRSIDSNEQGEELLLRLAAMGIVPDKPIQVLRRAWFGGPLHVRVGLTTEVAMRRQEAAQILIQA